MIGTTYSDITGIACSVLSNYTSEKWKIGRRQAENYIQKSRKFITESVTKDIDFALAVSRYNELYELSLKKKEFKTCVNIVKELSSLQGLAKNKVEHTGQITFISNIPK